MEHKGKGRTQAGHYWKHSHNVPNSLSDSVPNSISERIEHTKKNTSTK